MILSERMLRIVLRNQILLMNAVAVLHMNQGGSGSGYHAEELKQKAKDTNEFLYPEEEKE